MSNTKIFVAISKSTGGVMGGAKGQYAFGNVETLRRSIGQAYKYGAQKIGIKPMDMYSVHELDVAQMLPTPEANLKPFVVKEVNSTNWNDESHLAFYVNGKQKFSVGSFSECPEDASIDRDLDFVHSIAGLMELAYEAGKAGRPFEYTSEDEDEEE